MRVAVLPARNEAASLGAVIAELRRDAPDLQILVVDDASTDRTPALLEGLAVRHLRMPFRVGVGGAVRAGLRWCHARGAALAVRLDADGQHPASAIAAVAREIEEGRADAACGSRYATGARTASPGADAYLPPAARRAAGALLSLTLTALAGAPITDPTSGLWAFGSRAITLLASEHPSGYPEPELRLLLHARGLRCAEVPVAMRTRLAGRSSITVGRAAHALGRAALAMMAFRGASGAAHAPESAAVQER